MTSLSAKLSKIAFLLSTSSEVLALVPPVRNGIAYGAAIGSFLRQTHEEKTFLASSFSRERKTSLVTRKASAAEAMEGTPSVNVQQALYEPKSRDAKYGENVAQYLLDLHENEATFDFCGGMMFQLSLSDALQSHLRKVVKNSNQDQQPMIADRSKMRMHQLTKYEQSANADNISIFHGRELRKIPHAKGGYGFVLQLSLANSNDPEGWSKEEISTYDGWKHDVGRQWRTADVYEKEGFSKFKDKFGTAAFGLNHRFYLHDDDLNRMWLSAEDGCEGTPSTAGSQGGFNLGQLFGF